MINIRRQRVEVERMYSEENYMESLNGLNQRNAGVIAIAAGCIGLVSFGLLFGGLAASSVSPDVGRIGTGRVLLRGQDIAVALQALLMILVTLAILRQRTPLRQAPWLAAVGILGHVGVVLSIALYFAFGAGDMLYMLPQGLIRLWLIALCGAASSLSVSLRVIGVLAGIGLLLIAVGDAIIANALGWQIFDLRARPSVPAEAVSSQGNWLGHALLPIGTLLGRILYPIWSIAVGYKLIRRGNSIE